MGVRKLTRLILSLGSLYGSAAFVNLVPTSSTSTLRTADHLNLSPPSFSVLSTTTIAEERTVATETVASSRYYYADIQRPVYSFTDSSHALTPAVERVKRAIDDAKSAVSELAQRASKLGVSFGLSYSLLSNINGGVTLGVSWYMTCQRTGVSPVYQWKALLKTYGTMYAFLQALKPIRIAAAISLARTTEQWLDSIQGRFDCGRSKAVAAQYALGYVAQAIVASVGIFVASSASGVPVFMAP